MAPRPQLCDFSTIQRDCQVQILNHDGPYISLVEKEIQILGPKLYLTKNWTTKLMSKINAFSAKCKPIKTWNDEGKKWLKHCSCTKRNHLKTKQQEKAQEKFNEAQLVKALFDLNHEIEFSYIHLSTSRMEEEFSKFLKKRLRTFCPNKYGIDIINHPAFTSAHPSHFIFPDPSGHIPNTGEETNNSEQAKVGIVKAEQVRIGIVRASTTESVSSEQINIGSINNSEQAKIEQVNVGSTNNSEQAKIGIVRASTTEIVSSEQVNIGRLTIQNKQKMALSRQVSPNLTSQRQWTV